MIDLEIIWRSIAGNYTNNNELISACWNEIKKAYSSPARFYHNEMHLIFLFTLADSVAEQFDNRDAVYFALFYHDFQYDIPGNENEHKSAEFAQGRLEDLNVDEATIGRTIQHILATREHAEHNDPDTNFVCDLDLAILGADEDTYEGYVNGVRQEYAMIPDETFFAGRREFLTQLLKQNRLFKTQLFYQLYEDKARKNITNEISSIKINISDI